MISKDVADIAAITCGYLTTSLIALFVLSIFSGATNLTFVVGKYTIVIYEK